VGRRLGRRWGGREASGRLVNYGKQRGLRSLAQKGHADAGNGEGKERAWCTGKPTASA